MLGVLGWTPDAFWNATPYECSCAYIGWCKANGAGRWARNPDTGMTRDDMDAMVADFRELKRKVETGEIRPGKPPGV